MLASSFSQQQPSLDSLSMCEYCGAASIDLWKATTCEHYVCKKCLLNNEPSQAPRCTRCNGNSTLLCPGTIFGCKYQTTIPHNCLDHFRTCPRRPTPCPNECSSIVPNTDLPKHLTDECSMRTQECRFCYGNYFVSEIGNHLKDCQDYPLSCQYCNQENIRRGSFEEHGFGCRKTPKLCKMAAFGCTFKAGDDEMERHMTLEKHAFCMHEMKVQLNSMERELRRVREQGNREKQERQKGEEKQRKEARIADEETRKLRKDMDNFLQHFNSSWENQCWEESFSCSFSSSTFMDLDSLTDKIVSSEGFDVFASKVRDRVGSMVAQGGQTDASTVCMRDAALKFLQDRHDDTLSQ